MELPDQENTARKNSVGLTILHQNVILYRHTDLGLNISDIASL